MELQFILFCFNLLSQFLEASATRFSSYEPGLKACFWPIELLWPIVGFLLQGDCRGGPSPNPIKVTPRTCNALDMVVQNVANCFCTIAICFRIPRVCCDVVIAIYEEASSDWIAEVPLVFSLDDPYFSLRSTLLLSSSPSLSLSPSENLITRLSSFSSAAGDLIEGCRSCKLDNGPT